MGWTLRFDPLPVTVAGSTAVVACLVLSYDESILWLIASGGTSSLLIVPSGAEKEWYST